MKINFEKFNWDNEYSGLRYQIEHKHVYCNSQVSLFDIQLYQNNSIADNKLNELEALYVHREIKVDTDNVIKELNQRKR